MTFRPRVAEPLASGARSRRTRVIPRLVATLRAPILDADLAAGRRPSATPAHQLRADHLLTPRVRRRIAAALNRAVADSIRPARDRSAQVPLSREAIRRCQRDLRALAAAIATLENPRVQGVAIASQLAFDGGGPLFAQPAVRDSVERLANTIQAANAALRISGQFDKPGSDLDRLGAPHPIRRAS
jgi:hypothetical protein